MANFCMECGVPVDPSAKFCVICGQPLEQEQSQVRHTINTEAQPIEYPVEQQQSEIQHGVYPEARQIEYPVERQQYQPQPLYQGLPYQLAETKKKSKLPLILGIAGGVVVLIIASIVLLLNGVTGALKNMAKANYYEIGGDEVASIKLALGEQRTISGVSTANRKGVATKEITFSVDGSDQNEDMTAYMNYLLEDDFLLVTDVDFSGPEGEGVLGRNSIDDGYCILVELEYDDTGYVITLIRQKGDIETPDTDVLQGNDPVFDPDPGSNPGVDPGSNPGTDTDTDPNPNPNPNPGTGTDPGSLPVVAAGSAVEIFDTGCFHLIATFDVEGQGSIEMETYRNGDKAAIISRFNNVTTKTVIKDGKVYYIVDDLKTVYVNDTEAEAMMPEYGSAAMSYIGEGSGDFNGKTYPYSEYAEKDGGRSYYFMEGNTLKGIRVIITDNSVFDMTVLTLDTNVPDDVFSWPSNYGMQE